MSGAAITRTVDVDGWALRVGADEEPRVHDLDLAERLGFERPRKIRDLIARLEREGKLNESGIRPTVGRVRTGVSERTAIEYWLSEAAALKVVAKSETKKADALLDEVIRVFIAARRGLLPVPAPSPLPVEGEERASELRENDHAPVRELNDDATELVRRLHRLVVCILHTFPPRFVLVLCCACVSWPNVQSLRADESRRTLV